MPNDVILCERSINFPTTKIFELILMPNDVILCEHSINFSPTSWAVHWPSGRVMSHVTFNLISYFFSTNRRINPSFENNIIKNKMKNEKTQCDYKFKGEKRER
jgi:hypothetical protein